MQIDGIATLAGLYMPAFMPSCMTFKEVGCYIRNGYYINHLLVDSPDGLITNDHNNEDTNYCNQDVYNGDMENISVEISVHILIHLKYQCITNY